MKQVFQNKIIDTFLDFPNHHFELSNLKFINDSRNTQVLCHRSKSSNLLLEFDRHMYTFHFLIYDNSIKDCCIIICKKSSCKVNGSTLRIRLHLASYPNRLEYLRLKFTDIDFNSFLNYTAGI